MDTSYSLYSKSEQTRATYGVSKKAVQPFSSDAGPNRQKKNPKNVIFVFSALNYTCWYDLFLKNRKLQEIFGLQIYIYKDLIDLTLLQNSWFEKFVTAPVNKDPSSDCRSQSHFYDM